MFTGIIESTGTVVALRRSGRAARLEVAAPWRDLALGESVSVDGACLTVAAVLKAGFAADVSAESLGKTVIGRYQPGTAVNLERALKLGDRLGGHLVAGHVDCTAQIGTVIRRNETWDIDVVLQGNGIRYIATKGSVAVNGISLTVAEKLPGGFSLAIVPHTLRATTIGSWRTGDRVNIEYDLVAKYLEAYTTGRA
jgi:riboflavin synthase